MSYAKAQIPVYPHHPNLNSLKEEWQLLLARKVIMLKSLMFTKYICSPIWRLFYKAIYILLITTQFQL